MTPSSGTWYIRLLANRFLFDKIRKLIDPDYARPFARQQEPAKAPWPELLFGAWQSCRSTTLTTLPPTPRTDSQNVTRLPTTPAT
jgi:hypothetical protein